MSFSIDIKKRTLRENRFFPRATGHLDQKRFDTFKSFLTQSTVELYTAGEANTLNQWATGMAEHLLKCKRENRKIFITLIDDFPTNQMYVSQKQWFTYPETPSVAPLLYSYHAEKHQLTGRMLYPVKRNGKIQLLLENPKV